MASMSGYTSTKNVIERLRDVIKCQFCSQLKNEKDVLFFRTCHHFMCIKCVPNASSCPVCCNENSEAPHRLMNDKSLLDLYQQVAKLKMPSKEEIEKILVEHKTLQSQETVLFTPHKLPLTSKGNTPKKSEQSEAKKMSLRNTETPVLKERKSAVSNQKKELKELNEQKTPLAPKPPKMNDTEAIATPDSRKRAAKKEMVTPIGVTPATSRGTSAKMLDPKNGLVAPMGVAPATSRGRSAKMLDPKNENVAPMGVAPVTPGGTSTKKMKVAKRNAKGETPLHLACKKSNFDVMKDLIEAGANPNAQDNAGWTPLHDAVDKENLPVIKFLLENGAKANTPGLENTTALHQAVTRGNEEIIKLLLAYGADYTLRDIFGETPLALAKGCPGNLENMLLSFTHVETSSASADSSDEGSIVIGAWNLHKDHQTKVEQFCNIFEAENTMDFMNKNILITHLVVDNEADLKLNWSNLNSISRGIWVVKLQWIAESVRCSSLKPAELFEITGPENGFQKARQNRINQRPGLFSGCHFFFGGQFQQYNLGVLGEVSKTEVKALCERLGATVLTRCPDPESLALEKTVPFHANVDGGLANCSYYIIYDENKWNPQPKYNMGHMKTLPVEWLVTCVLRCSLLDPGSLEEDYADWLRQ